MMCWKPTATHHHLHHDVVTGFWHPESDEGQRCLETLQIRIQTKTYLTRRHSAAPRGQKVTFESGKLPGLQVNPKPYDSFSLRDLHDGGKGNGTVLVPFRNMANTDSLCHVALSFIKSNSKLQNCCVALRIGKEWPNITWLCQLGSNWFIQDDASAASSPSSFIRRHLFPALQANSDRDCRNCPACSLPVFFSATYSSFPNLRETSK